MNNDAGVTGTHLGHVWSGWAPRDNTRATVRVGAPTGATQGVQMDTVEYRTYAAGAIPYFPSLRFPGQYADAETDKYINWNRFYDPSTGRYLQPEPMLYQPTVQMVVARAGAHLPVHAYAVNNPVNYVDATGLIFGPRANGAQSDSFNRALLDPILGPKIRAMAAAQDLYVWFPVEAPPNGSREVFSPTSFITEFLEESGRFHGDVRNQCSVTVQVDVARDNVRAAYLLPGVHFTYDDSLVHELGHVYQEWQNWRAGTVLRDTGATAREWENVIRNAMGHGIRPPDPGHP